MSFTQDVRPNTGHEFTLVREFDAPRDLVFRMWVDPAHLNAWSCPHGFTIPEATGGPARRGESFAVTMQGPDGQKHRLRGTYLDVSPVSRIVFTHAWEGEDGALSPETTVDVRLDDLGGSTRLTLHQAFFDNAGASEGHEGGWSESLDKLAQYIAAHA